METSIKTLLRQCSGVENLIEDERIRLKSLKGELLECIKVHESLIQKNTNGKLEVEIKECKSRESQLFVELHELQNDVKEKKKEITNVYAPELDKKRRSLNHVSAVLNAINFEIRTFDTKIQSMRKINNQLEYDYKRKLQELGVKSCSNKELQMGNLMNEEEEAKEKLEKLKANLSRMKEIVDELKRSLSQSEAQCDHQEKMILEREYKHLAQLDRVLNENCLTARSLQSEIKKHKEHFANLKTIQIPSPVEGKSDTSVNNETEVVEECRKKIQQLQDEYTDFLNAIMDIRKEKDNFYEQFTKRNNITLRQINAEQLKLIHKTEDVERSIDKTKNDNDLLNITYRKKLEEHIGTKAINEREIGRFKVEEESAKEALQELKSNRKKLEEKLNILYTVLSDLEQERQGEECKANQMNQDLMEAKEIEKRRKREGAH